MEYGLLGKKYVLGTFDGEITLHGERENLPKEGIFEIDDEYSYLYGKTSIYFYNFSNNKPTNLDA